MNPEMEVVLFETADILTSSEDEGPYVPVGGNWLFRQYEIAEKRVSSFLDGCSLFLSECEVWNYQKTERADELETASYGFPEFKAEYDKTDRYSDFQKWLLDVGFFHQMLRCYSFKYLFAIQKLMMY